MLMKALFTGGLLSVMAGSIVYFGTEGAIAEGQKTEAERVEHDATELAGGEGEAAESIETAQAETLTPDQSDEGFETVTEVVTVETRGFKYPKEDETTKVVEAVEGVDAEEVLEAAKSDEQPKKKWLDHYLKSEKKTETHTEAQQIETADTSVEPQGHGSATHSETQPESTDVSTEPQSHGSATHGDSQVEATDVMAKPQGHGSATHAEPGSAKTYSSADKAPIVDPMTDKKMESNGLGSSTNFDHGSEQTEALAEPVEMKAVEDMGSSKTYSSEDMGSSKTYSSESDTLTSEKMMDEAVIERHARSDRNPISSKEANVNFILDEARKIEIVDMRDEAILEILDFVLDHNKSGKAADILTELSSPELRDTARARIGVHLARHGKTVPAFAVMDEIEIEELRAPIRLEIITTLMATREEKNRLKLQSSQ